MGDDEGKTRCTKMAKNTGRGGGGRGLGGRSIREDGEENASPSNLGELLVLVLGERCRAEGR